MMLSIDILGSFLSYVCLGYLANRAKLPWPLLAPGNGLNCCRSITSFAPKSSLPQNDNNRSLCHSRSRSVTPGQGHHRRRVGCASSLRAARGALLTGTVGMGRNAAIHEIHVLEL